MHEDATVVLSRDGWVKRVREVKDPTSTRLREGDASFAVLPGTTRDRLVLFSTHGSVYVLRVADVPATTGYGEPVQSLLKFGDGERVVAARLLRDDRVDEAGGDQPALPGLGGEKVVHPVMLVATAGGLRLPRHARSLRDHPGRPAPGARRRRRRDRLGRAGDRAGRSWWRRRAARCCASPSTRSPSCPGRGAASS